MKFLIFTVLLALASAQNYDSFEDDFEEINPFMNSNVLAVVGEFPAAVFIQADGSPTHQLCGGSLIDRQHILTSAQCGLNMQNQLINPFWFTVTAGDRNIVTPTSQRLTRRLSRVYVHPNFNPQSRNNDLAVLRVDEPFPDFHNSIEPAIRANRVFADATVCRFAAWGAAQNASAIQPELRTMNAPIIPTATCNVPNVHANRVLPNVHICAGSITATNPVTGACRGNIGSGLYCGAQLTGVLSFGFSCGAANQPGVYTNVRWYQDWINQQLVRTDNPQPGWQPSPTS